MKDMHLVASSIEKWIREQIAAAGAEGAVFGLSGGVDSAVVAGLCKRALDDRCLAVIMPCYSNSLDVEHARLVAETFQVPYTTVDLSSTFDTLLKELNNHLIGTGTIPRGAVANIKPRLRMTTLYFYAACYNYLVMGTGNRSEIAIGYFTKYGDGGVDLEPIGHLLKEEVRELAAYLGVPEVIINKAPSAGLWKGQTDEGELGFTYAQLDHYLKFQEAPPEIKAKIEALQRASDHKRRMPPIPTT